MKECPNCHEEVDDHFDICWNCNYSFIEKKVLDENEFEEEGQRKLECLRCHVPMRYSGEYGFHEGTRFGALGNLLELFENKERFDLYVCPQCGKIEFFIPYRKK